MAEVERFALPGVVIRDVLLDSAGGDAESRRRSCDAHASANDAPDWLRRQRMCLHDRAK